MDVVRPWLLVGKLAETLNLDLLHYMGVGAMLQLCQEVTQPGIVSRFLPVEDGEPLPCAVLSDGVRFIREQKAEGRSVLVACGAGVSRSVTFAVAALREEEGISLLDAYREVVAARAEARPHPVLWKSLCDCYGESVPFAEMIKISRPLRGTWS
jgi:hypothetical protein